jgi:hypothetical protein
MSNGYNIKKTHVQEEKLADWLRRPVSKNLQDIPGIGRVNERLLSSGDVETCHQLIAKYLSFHNRIRTTPEICDLFYFWLKNQGINSGRHNIILAISEKTELYFPK